jgi:type III secretory pathway component EscR
MTKSEHTHLSRVLFGTAFSEACIILTLLRQYLPVEKVSINILLGQLKVVL